MPDAQRQGVVHAWVTNLMIAEAPHEFIEAVACLIDDAVAEKAYEVIFTSAGAAMRGKPDRQIRAQV